MKKEEKEAPDAHPVKGCQEGSRLTASVEVDPSKVKLAVSIPKYWIEWLQRHLRLLRQAWMLNQATDILFA